MSRNKIRPDQVKDHFKLIIPPEVDYSEEKGDREEEKEREVREVREAKEARKGRKSKEKEEEEVEDKERKESHQRQITAQKVRVKLPNVRLPKSFLGISPNVEDEPKGDNDIASENMKLKLQNRQLQNKIKDLEETNKMLMSVNEAFGLENDQLNEKLDRYKSIQQPEDMKKSEDRSHKRQKTTNESKQSTRSNYDSGSDESLCTQVNARINDTDEKQARMEMKIVLKTIPPECDLDYNETFMSQKNLEKRRKLIPELIKSLKPNYNASNEQITRWLRSIHRSRRSRINYVKKGRIDYDDRRLHANGRLNDKKIRRIKGARSLYATKNSEIMKYDQDELIGILRDNKFHSPEVSETDEEDTSGKRLICVYDCAWRSKELKKLLRNVLDPYSLTLQTAQLSRPRVYNDDLQHYDLPPPQNAPNWTRVERNHNEIYHYDTDTDQETGDFNGETATAGMI